jgi:hypothetical protein
MPRKNRSSSTSCSSLTYEELRRLAASVHRNDPSLTLNTTALVNEAWLKLAASPAFTSLSQLHFNLKRQ